MHGGDGDDVYNCNMEKREITIKREEEEKKGEEKKAELTYN